MVDVLVAFRRTEQDLSGLSCPPARPRPPSPPTTPAPRGPRAWTRIHHGARHASTLRPRRAPSSSCSATTRPMEPAAPSSARCSSWPTATTSAARFSENRVVAVAVPLGAAVGPGRRPRGCGCRCAAAYFQGAPGDDNRLEVGSEFYYVRRRFGFRGMDVRRPRWSGARVAGLRAGRPAASLLVDDERLPSRIGVAKQPIESVAAGRGPGRHLDLPGAQDLRQRRRLPAGDLGRRAATAWG